MWCFTGDFEQMEEGFVTTKKGLEGQIASRDGLRAMG